QPLPAEAAPPAVRAALDRALAQALDFDPSQRIASAERLAELIASAARGALASPALAPKLERRGSELRVATVLVFRCDALGDSDAEHDDHVTDSGDTRLVPLSVPGEDLERVIVDLGGTPVAVGALEVTALFGAPQSLGDDAVRAARAARQLIDRTRGGRAGLDTTRVLLRAATDQLASTDALAIAQALCASARAGEALASAPAGRQLAAHHELEPAGEQAG